MASDVVSRKRLAREQSLPEIPRSLGEEAIASLGAMREQVERLSGKAGDASDRAVRLFEVEMGLLSAFVPTGVDVARNATPGGGGLRILKAPRGLQYEHLIFGIRLTWENVEPRHSAVEIWCAEDSLLLDDAWRVGVATKPMSEWTMHGISMRINYTFWIRAVDWGGGVSPWCPPQGQGGLVVPAEIDTTVVEVLELLTGQVTESQLYQALSERIDLVDGPDTMPGSVAARVGEEAATRAAAILAEETSRTEGLAAAARSLEALAVQLRGGYSGSDLKQVTSGLLYSERNARTTADSALSNRMDLIVAASSGDFQDLFAAVSNEETARVDADDALANDISTITARLDNVKDASGNPTNKSVEATLVDNKQAQVSGDAAEASSRQTLATQLRGSYAGTDVNQVTSGLIYAERVARVTADSAMASDISALEVSVGNNAAALTTEQGVRASADSAMASNITTLQTTVGGHTAAIQEQALVIDGLEAQWFVKLDVDGRVSGVGLHGTGATSEFVVLADKFMVVTPGETPKVPFVVGPMGDTGENGVGIDGNMVVNGTVLTRHLSADSVTADKIGADQVSGQHIAATSEITLNEGGKLTVGQNNVILDSTENKIIIAPDNGTIIGQEDLSGIDYCELAQGDISFMYWNGASHQLYNSLKRVEMGMDCINGVRVTIPGIWKEQPKIIVSPASIMSYNKNYDANQTIICTAEDISKIGNTYAFTPRAYLRLTDGQIGLGINLATNVSYSGSEDDIWHYANTSTRSTPTNTTALTVSGNATTEYWLAKVVNRDGNFETIYFSERAYIRIWIVVDGVEYYVGEWSAKQVGVAGYSFTKTISGLATGVHSYYVRMGLMNHDDIHWSSGGPGTVKGSVTATREVTNQSTYQVLADGTLNYMAIGE